MFVVYGHSYFGRVDDVHHEGQLLFYVVTKFYHLYYFPLMPASSHLVIAGSETGDGFRGVDIPLSGKSVLIAWVRACALVAALVCIFAFFAASGSHAGYDRMSWGTLLVGTVLAYLGSRKLAPPSEGRRQELLGYAGLELQPSAAPEPYFTNPAAPAPSPAPWAPPARSAVNTKAILAHVALAAVLAGVCWAGFRFLSPSRPQPLAAAAPTPAENLGLQQLEQARQCLAARDYSSAAVSGEVAARSLEAQGDGANFQQALAVTAQAYLLGGKAEKAQPIYQQLVKLAPDNAEYAAGLKQSIEIPREARRKQADAQLAAARASLKSGDLPAARRSASAAMFAYEELKLKTEAASARGVLTQIAKKENLIPVAAVQPRSDLVPVIASRPEPTPTPYYRPARPVPTPRRDAMATSAYPTARKYHSSSYYRNKYNQNRNRSSYVPPVASSTPRPRATPTPYRSTYRPPARTSSGPYRPSGGTYHPPANSYTVPSY